MKKKNKGIKICVYGGLTALALTGTMVLCNEINYKEVKPQETSISAESKEEMVKSEHVFMGYNENGEAIYKEVSVYPTKVQNVLVGYDENGQPIYEEQFIEISSKTR